MMKERLKPKTILTGVLSFLFLTAITLVFSVLCVYRSELSFVQEKRALFAVISCVLTICAFGFSVWSVATRREMLYKIMLSVFGFVIFCLVLLFILQMIGFFQIVKDAESLQAYIAKAGAWMPLLYILLQYLQVVLLPIPGTLSTVVGVALFGPFRATLYSLLGIILGSFTAFFIGRKFGYKAAIWLVGEDTLLRWQKKLKGKDNLVLTLMFLLPMFPDDVLCIIAGLSSMSTRYFLTMISIARVLAIVTTCYSVDIIPLNTWWGLLTWGILLAVFAVAFILIYKNMDKLQKWLAKKFNFFKKNK